MSIRFDPKKTIFLIDGSGLLYRGYYGVRQLTTSQGVPVQAVYNFCRMIKRMIDTFQPLYITIVWDSAGKTTRHTMYEEYKATRQAPPSDLFEQKKLIVEFIDLIHMVQIAQPGIEADDLIYSLARDFANTGDNVVMVTSDKDMGQALSDHIFLYDPQREIIYDQATFAEKMGFSSRQLPFYHALVGDASDNIPGVRGIGQKTALELVKQFDSLEDLYNRIGQLKVGRARTALQEYKNDAFLSYKLFLLQYHSLELTKNNVAFDAANWQKARSLFERLEFTSLLKGLGEGKQSEQSVEVIIEQLKKKYDFRLVTTEAQLQQLCALVQEKKVCAFDTETDGLNALNTNLVGISFCVQAGQAFYIPCGHNTMEEQLSLDRVRAALKPIFEDSTIKKYGQNLKFDQLVLAGHGILVAGTIFDTFIAASLVKKNWQSAGLKELSLHYLNEPMLTYEQVVKGPKYKNFSYVPLAIALYYAAADAHQTFRLVPILENELMKEEMQTLYYDIEFPLIDVLFTMELRGVYVDVADLVVLGQHVTKALVHLEDEIRVIVGIGSEHINLNSPKQVQELLFDRLQLPPMKKSAKNTGYSTDQEVLNELAKLHPVPGLIIKYRELTKLKTTYIDALPTFVNSQTGRVHTTFSQARVATGRLSSSDPNLQNIPTDSGYGIAIRGAFKPTEGNLFISADYSQIELRVLAYLSQDANLCEAFLTGLDIHAQTASRLFEVSLAQVTHDQRQLGKRINFSILYGLTPYGLSKDLGISFKDAKLYIDKYFAQYPGVSEWMEKTIEAATKNGYVTTYWGRRRDVPGIYEKNRALQEEAKRVAINTVAQGTAAEIMKQGMLHLERVFKDEKIDAQMLLQIHDELLISVSKEKQALVQDRAKEVLESVVDWNVPLVVTTRAGIDWKAVTK